MQRNEQRQRQRIWVFCVSGYHEFSMWPLLHVLASGFLLAQLVACSTPAAVGDSQFLSFLQDGSTTHEDVYLHLAEPSAIFESGRIQTYLLDEDRGGYILMHRSEHGWNGKYSLVLAFDEQGVLRRHSLVRIRAYPNSP